MSHGRAPRMLGRYEILRLIGEGGMAAVYEGLHTGLAKRVAVKTLLPSVAALPGARARFMREARAAARISHPNVVNVTDVGEEGDVAFLVMELLAGETLADYLARKGALPVERLAQVMLPVLAAIGAGHDVGVIHRDLKPQNVFIARDFRGNRTPKVVDFGLSRILDETATDPPTLPGERAESTGLRFGTSQYLAPEQVAGRGADDSTDQYALGLLLYECAAGRPANDESGVYGMLRTALEARVQPLRALRPDLPAELEAVIMRALARERRERFSSVYALGNALLPFAGERARLRWAPTFEGRED